MFATSCSDTYIIGTRNASDRDTISWFMIVARVKCQSQNGKTRHYKQLKISSLKIVSTNSSIVWVISILRFYDRTKSVRLIHFARFYFSFACRKIKIRLLLDVESMLNRMKKKPRINHVFRDASFGRKKCP